MCRNIKQLYNFEPPANEDEIRAAALQFVRKVSGFKTPSKANEVAFHTAVDEITAVSRTLLSTLETNAPPPRPPGRGGQGAGTHRQAFCPLKVYIWLRGRLSLPQPNVVS